MLPNFSSRKADIAHNADEASSRNQDAITFRDYLLKTVKELLVIVDSAELPICVWILLESPVRRRCDYKLR